MMISSSKKQLLQGTHPKKAESRLDTSAAPGGSLSTQRHTGGVGVGPLRKDCIHRPRLCLRWNFSPGTSARSLYDSAGTGTNPKIRSNSFTSRGCSPPVFAYMSSSRCLMPGSTSQSLTKSSLPASSAKTASCSSLSISDMADALFPCIASPTAFTRDALQRRRNNSRSSFSASSADRPKLAPSDMIEVLFCAYVWPGSSRHAVATMRNSDRSCGRVSSRSFFGSRSHFSQELLSASNSAEVTAGAFSRRRTLL
mmetsp:Transcript_25844/g.69018  ORF Transcript_25844/g.69018 Transcript_25844/m.69018 type:complete len:254 (+) Transcript_25844:66-827(+)